MSPHQLPLLKDLLLLLLTSVPIAFVCSRLRLPVIVGFMIAGILIGPFGFGLIQEMRAVEALAEIGVVLLLFVIGLEFSLRRLVEMKRVVIGGGFLQVILTILLVYALAWASGREHETAIFFGFLSALSSTAIVLKSYSDRAELDTPHGRVGVGILLFQDLSVVPMMLLIPILAGKEGRSVTQIAFALGTALLAMAIIILAARLVVPYLLYHIVRLRSSEVFVIFIVLVGLGTSYLTAQLGLSLALGAFVAGLVLSESEYSHQIVAELLPFRDVFNSIFFVSIGMLLSLSFLSSHILSVLLLLGALVIGKALVVLVAMRLLNYSLRVSVMTGVGLAQLGEFSFIVAKVGAEQGLLQASDHQIFLAAAILSMMATPFLIQLAPRLGYALQSALSPKSRLESEATSGASDGGRLRGHTIVVGYGLNGRNLSTVLRRVGIPYLIVELNPELVRASSARSEPIQYGDATRKEVLCRAGLPTARILVLAISDPIATRRTVRLARDLNPHLHIIVRTRYMSEVPDLYQLGANQVIPEEFETSVEIFSRVLREYGLARHEIDQQVEEIRREGYRMLRTPSLATVERSELAKVLNAASTETMLLSANSAAIGKTIGELKLRKLTGATVIAVVRDGQTQINPGADFTLAAGDTLVLLGSPEQVSLAIEQIQITS
jgi:CPA2 family monovalent cation:H+ antiporter-2